MEVSRGTQYWGLKFHTDCEVMSRTADAKDPNAAQRPRASSYPCLQQHFPPKNLSLLQTQSLCHASPGILQWEALCWWVSPRGLQKRYIPAEERSANWASISSLLPCDPDGRACRHAGLLDSAMLSSRSLRWTERCSTVPGLTQRQYCKDTRPWMCHTLWTLPYPPLLQANHLTAPRQLPTRSECRSQGERRHGGAEHTRAVAPSPGSLHAKAPSASALARGGRSPGKWHREITNVAGSIPWWISWTTRILSAACTLCGKEPSGQ